MTAWRWIDRAVLIAIHDMQLAEHGGGAGLRDGNLLEDTLVKPENLAASGNPDVAVLAAAYGYGYGISRNHAFIKRKKRTALVAAELFLQLNGWWLGVDDADCVLAMLAIATGDTTQNAFAGWLHLHAHKKLVR